MSKCQSLGVSKCQSPRLERTMAKKPTTKVATETVKMGVEVVHGFRP